MTIIRVAATGIYLYLLYSFSAGSHHTTYENSFIFGDETEGNITKGEYSHQRGEIYIKLLNDIFSLWEIQMKDLAIMTDDKGTDIAYSLMASLGPGVQTLFKEKKEQNVSHLFTEMIFYTDTNYFVFTVSSTLYQQLVEQIVSLNLDLPCRVWIFISVEDVSDPRVCTFKSDSLNLYFIRPLQQTWSVQKTGYTTYIEECHFNEGKYSLHKTIHFDIDDGIVLVQNISRIPSKELYLRIVGLHEPPFQYKVRDKFTGYNMDILDYISLSVGFKYRTLECNQNLYGFFNETTKKWSGCVSDLAYGRADLIIVGLHMMSSREAAIDYILPWTGYSGLIILAHEQQRMPFNFWNAFTPRLWITILAIFIFSFLLLSFFGQVLSRCNSPSSDFSSKGIFECNTFKRAFWFLTSSCAFEGTGKVPYGQSVRVVIASIWVFIQIFMSIFLGQIAAFLISSGTKTEITSLDDLINQHTVNFTFLRDNSIGEHIFYMSNIEKYFDQKWTRYNLDNETFSTRDKIVWTNPLTLRYTKLWERSFTTGFINTTGEAIQKIKRGNFMLVSDSAVAEFVAGDDCDLKTIGRKISARPYGFAIRKFSSIKANISKALLQLQELPLMYEIKRRWWKTRKDCPRAGEDKGINMPEMVGLFYLLITGLCIGMLVLITEKLQYRHSESFVINQDNNCN